MSKRRTYHDFAERIDIDALEEAIKFDPITSQRGEDIGFCIFPENHSHGDSTGKFAINREKRLWNCFVCGGGDLLSLAMLHLDVDYEEATNWLYQFAGPDRRSDSKFADDLLEMLEDVHERRETMPYFNQRVLERFDGPLDYFYSRGISPEVAESVGLRYSEEALKSAPVKMMPDGSRVKKDPDYVGPASIWPHYWNGKLVGWQYRWTDFDKDHTKTPKWLPKWTNTTDFPKATTLYNYDYALQSRNRIVVCESLGTVLFLRSFDIPAVAYFGSRPSDEQLRLLRRFQQGVILAPDNDANMAGDKILGTVDYLERYIPVWIADKVEGPDGADLGDYAKTDKPYEDLMIHMENRVRPAGLSL
jgi:DNA primase